MKLKRLLWIVTAVGGLAASGGWASTIEGLGVDGTTGDRWRSPASAKSATLDINGDGAYASSGYYILQNSGAGDFNGNTVLLSQLPSFLDSGYGIVTSPSMYTYANNAQMKALDDPTVPIPISGYAASLTPQEAGSWWADAASLTAPTGGWLTNAFSFKLAVDADFVLTALFDGNSTYAANRLEAIRVVGPGGVTNEISGLAASVGGTREYAFFRIQGNAGDTFVVSLQAASTSQGLVFDGLGFEMIPEPSTIMLLGVGGGLLWRRRTRRNG